MLVGNCLYIESIESNQEKIYQALKDNNHSAILALLKEGLDLNIKPRKHTTPLIYACRHSNYDTIKLLLEHGADVHNKGGVRYPLRQAIMRGDFKIVKLLLDYGADIHYRNREGCEETYYIINDTAFELAAIVGQIKILEYLYKNYKIPEEEFNNALVYSSRENQGKIMLFLFNNHSFPSSIINKALARCIFTNSENFNAVKILIDRGANVNYIYNNKSMLDYAIHYKHSKILKLLKEHGAKTAKEILRTRQ
jgi:ankyrin repeat protein